MLRICSPGDADWDARLRASIHRVPARPLDVEAQARAIVDEVRSRGDAAVREISEKFAGRKLVSFEIPRVDWLAAAAGVAAPVRAAIERAAARVRAFHERDRPQSFEHEEGGIRLGSRVLPLARVLVYVPGGTARYPSTVLMTAVPAKVAGVGEIVMTTPGPSAETLAAALVAGVDRVFAIGGAQAIAAFTYGTETVPRVDKIAGPGNAWVTAAKRLVFGDTGIDAVAGPTEIVIAADASADPAWIAADLVAQAEHDTLAVPILVAVGLTVAERVAVEVDRQLAGLPRRDIAAQAIADQGVAFVVATTAEAVELVNRLAPEHAELALTDARALAAGVKTAGALFVGAHTPEPVGDYYAGPSHVLPTSGSARFSSPLGVGDFVRRMSVIEYDAAALGRHADDIVSLAEVEGLAGHARAVSIRTGRRPLTSSSRND